MVSKDKRILDPSFIPSSLWDPASETLILPLDLKNIYKRIIHDNNLLNLALSRDRNSPPVGGGDKEKTDQHFAQAFDSSVARAQLSLLDPKNDIAPTSNVYLSVLAGNKLSLIDAPCGAGAAAFSFLVNIAELRAQNVLPRMPLDVFFIAAELSDFARNYAEIIFEELKPLLENQAIFVNSKFLSWDVTDKMSNTALIEEITRASGVYNNRLLIVANFNGFLEKGGKRKEAQPQLEELFRYASGDKSVAIWIEPNMNTTTVKGGFFPWLKDKLKNIWKRFAQELPLDKDSILTSSANFQLVLKPSEIAPVRLAVMPIKLERSK